MNHLVIRDFSHTHISLRMRNLLHHWNMVCVFHTKAYDFKERKDLISIFSSLYFHLTGSERYRGSVRLSVPRQVRVRGRVSHLAVRASAQRDRPLGGTNGAGGGARHVLLSDDSGSTGSAHSRSGTVVLHLLRLLWTKIPEGRERRPWATRYRCSFCTHTHTDTHVVFVNT